MKKLHVIGDSISIQYGPYLSAMVAGTYEYSRKEGSLANLDLPEGANGGDSAMVLDYICKCRAAGLQYDILLVNCGLHDIKTALPGNAIQIAPEQYVQNLLRIVSEARAFASRVIWARTTPVVDDIHNSRTAEFRRFGADVIRYNGLADQVMEAAGISSIDLYGFTLPFIPQAYCDHVHYTEDMRRLQAAFIAGYLHACSR